jgi:excisionase family DNA binding protein
VDDLLTTKQLQKLLQIDRTTIYRMLKDGRLTGVKVGIQWRFKRQDVEALLSEVPSLKRDQPFESTTPFQNIPLDFIQIIQDIFAESARVGAVITTFNGELLTKLSNCCRFCSLIMASESGRRSCVDLWRELANQPEDQPKYATCHAGLQYVRAGIKANGHFEGMLIAGQFYTDRPEADEEQARIRRLVKEHGLDAQALTEAAQEISVFDDHQRAQLSVWLDNVVRHLA